MATATKTYKKVLKTMEVDKQDGVIIKLSMAEAVALRIFLGHVGGTKDSIRIYADSIFNSLSYLECTNSDYNAYVDPENSGKGSIWCTTGALNTFNENYGE